MIRQLLTMVKMAVEGITPLGSWGLGRISANGPNPPALAIKRTAGGSLLQTGLHQLVRRDRQLPHPLARGVIDGVGDGRGDAGDSNLADAATLIKLADDCGLPGKQLVERSGTEEISAVYEQNRQDALAADVFGSPVYVLDGEVFWGQDRIELLADALKSGRAPYLSQV